MRLLNISTHTLKEFLDKDNVPPYAILSHRWREEEVSFSDIGNLDVATQMQGFTKITRCCTQASEANLDYIWVDTCCIDKGSSSELSEAINSMFSWYKNAAVCYVYLDDVKANPQNEGIQVDSFKKSEWFKRGWTLQELIAPRRIIFFAEDWTSIGTKVTLTPIIERITNIQRSILLFDHDTNVSVATKMSWAADRKTTREEDRAYSLMGLFGVNMPTIYGEGGRSAFLRLQEEIMKLSSDHSIFAWRRHWWNNVDMFETSGLLASSPDDFATSYNVVPITYSAYMKRYNIVNTIPEYSLSNYGVRIQLPLSLASARDKLYVGYLACQFENDGPLIAIYLQLIAPGQYLRTWLTILSEVPPEKVINHDVVKPENLVYVKQETEMPRWHLLDNEWAHLDVVGFEVDLDCEKSTFVIIGQAWSVDTESGKPPSSRACQLRSFEPDLAYMASSFSVSPKNGYGSVVLQHVSTGEVFSVTLGMHENRVWSDIVTNINVKTASRHLAARAVYELYDLDVYPEGRGNARAERKDWISECLVGGKTAVLSLSPLRDRTLHLAKIVIR